MSTVPQFDPTQPASEVTIGSMRYLEQGGHKFTYANQNKADKTWKPFPQYVYDDQASFDELKDMATKVLLDSRQLQQSMDRLSNAIMKKVGLGGEALPDVPVAPKSTSPFEELYVADLPPFDTEVQDQPTAEPVAEEVKKKPRTPRKRSGGRSKKVAV